MFSYTLFHLYLNLKTKPLVEKANKKFCTCQRVKIFVYASKTTRGINSQNYHEYLQTYIFHFFKYKIQKIQDYFYKTLKNITC